MRKNKYNAVKCEHKGMKFDSRKELSFYLSLICDNRVETIDRQVRYNLLPSQKINGKTVERPVDYILDFRVTMKGGAVIYYDAKGLRTPAYVIKRKMMLFFHGIKITEV